MCGIIGYNGINDATLFIGKGLKYLEYRGYDSYGSAFISELNKIFIHKSKGCVLCNYDKFLRTKVKSKCGIGHARWVTTGKNTIKNSHPHYGGKNKDIALVHNGIISNYKELKTILIQRGYTFQSETDTEVLAHWIHLTNSFDEIEGDFACLFIKKNIPNIYTIRRNTPLFIANVNNGNILSSSINVFDMFSSNYDYLELENNKLFEINKDKININWHKRSSLENKYTVKTTLEEIKEQTFQNIKTTVKLKKNKKLVIFGCGSSYNASLLSKHFFYKNNFINVEVVLPSELKNISPKTQYIAVSQSGETKDVLNVARQHQKIFYAITNKENNTLEKLAKKTIYLDCGTEVGVAATKSFTSTLSLLCQLAGEHINTEKLNNVIHKIFNTHYPRKFRKFAKIEHIFLLGHGSFHHVNLEGALKLKEMANIHAEAIHISEIKHGLITLINKNTLSIFTGNEKVEETIDQIKARNGKILLLSQEELTSENNLIIMPKITGELESLIVVTIYLQIIALELGKIRGVNVDHPANLAKCVTV